MIDDPNVNPWSKRNILLGIAASIIGYILQDWIFYSTQGSRILFWMYKWLGINSNIYWFFNHIWGWPFR